MIGQLMIGRLHGNHEGNVVRVRVQQGRVTLFQFSISLGDFTKAVMGEVVNVEVEKKGGSDV